MHSLCTKEIISRFQMKRFLIVLLLAICVETGHWKPNGALFMTTSVGERDVLSTFISNSEVT